MGFATSQTLGAGNPIPLELELRSNTRRLHAQPIHSSTLCHTLRVPRNVHSDKRYSFLLEYRFLAAILLIQWIFVMSRIITIGCVKRHNY